MNEGPSVRHLHASAPPVAGRDLVVLRAGRRSLHTGWIDPEGVARFDLLVARYEPGPSLPIRPGYDEIDLPGRKVAGYAELFRRSSDPLARYDFIALFDYDLLVAQDGIERLFDVAYETGIEPLWYRLTEAPLLHYAIGDEVSATHTRPECSTKVRQGFAKDKTYGRQIAAILDWFGVSLRGIVTYAAIQPDRRRTESRLGIALRSLGRSNKLDGTSIAARHFVRILDDSLRDCVVRALNFSPVAVTVDAGSTMSEPSESST